MSYSKLRSESVVKIRKKKKRKKIAKQAELNFHKLKNKKLIFFFKLKINPNNFYKQSAYFLKGEYMLQRIINL